MLESGLEQGAGEVDREGRSCEKGLSSDSSGSLGRASQDNRCQRRAKTAESVPRSWVFNPEPSLEQTPVWAQTERRSEVR